MSPNDLIQAIASRVRPAPSEAETWDQIASAYEAVQGVPLDRADPYHIMLAGAVYDTVTVGHLFKHTGSN